MTKSKYQKNRIEAVNEHEDYHFKSVGIVLGGAAVGLSVAYQMHDYAVTNKDFEVGIYGTLAGAGIFLGSSLWALVRTSRRTNQDLDKKLVDLDYEETMNGMEEGTQNE